MPHIDPALDPTRFNRAGLAGNRGSESNVVDSYLQTYEVLIPAQTGSLTFDTGIVLPKYTSPISGFVFARTPEVTGATKTLTVGFSASPTGYFNNITTDNTNANGSPLTVTTTPDGATMLITFGSDDWVEYEGVMILTMQCVRG